MAEAFPSLRAVGHRTFTAGRGFRFNNLNTRPRRRQAWACKSSTLSTPSRRGEVHRRVQHHRNNTIIINSSSLSYNNFSCNSSSWWTDRVATCNNRAWAITVSPRWACRCPWVAAAWSACNSSHFRCKQSGPSSRYRYYIIRPCTW